ncbi:JAB domain-containing protein, partial [Xanthomonas phaseoli]|uniref:JAB domain-containing protein n=1 Tax=Xanthomonas phaseoli TaxID=1985254 RepID=UPI003D16221C
MEAGTRTCPPSDGGPAPSQEVIRARDDKIVARALRILEQRACEPGPRLGDVSKCGAFFRLRLGGEIREHFEVAFLDNQHRLIGVERLFSGSVEGAEVHPRIVVQRALALNAAAVIVAHNHPSGHTESPLKNPQTTSIARLHLRYRCAGIASFRYATSWFLAVFAHAYT